MHIFSITYASCIMYKETPLRYQVYATIYWRDQDYVFVEEDG